MSSTAAYFSIRFAMKSANPLHSSLFNCPITPTSFEYAMPHTAPCLHTKSPAKGMTTDFDNRHDKTISPLYRSSFPWMHIPCSVLSSLPFRRALFLGGVFHLGRSFNFLLSVKLGSSYNKKLPRPVYLQIRKFIKKSPFSPFVEIKLFKY